MDSREEKLLAACSDVVWDTWGQRDAIFCCVGTLASPQATETHTHLLWLSFRKLFDHALWSWIHLPFFISTLIAVAAGVVGNSTVLLAEDWFLWASAPHYSNASPWPKHLKLHSPTSVIGLNCKLLCLRASAKYTQYKRYNIVVLKWPD